VVLAQWQDKGVSGIRTAQAEGAGLLLGLHAGVFFIDDVDAHLALAIAAADQLVVFVALFQRLERGRFFHGLYPV
jgi:hypothetical protein